MTLSTLLESFIAYALAHVDTDKIRAVIEAALTPIQATAKVCEVTTKGFLCTIHSEKDLFVPPSLWDSSRTSMLVTALPVLGFKHEWIALSAAVEENDSGPWKLSHRRQKIQLRTKT